MSDQHPISNRHAGDPTCIDPASDQTAAAHDAVPEPPSRPLAAGASSHGAALPRFEGYQLIAPLGQGGMGTVWRGVQLGTKREVALKVMSGAGFGSSKAAARFEREVELTAKLAHPHIARVYESGVHQGMFYYAMELIDGLPLDEYVAVHRLSPIGILELMRLVCMAVAHAHQRGIIHRDLKPSNILVTRDSQPKVLDFGLAKAFQETDSAISIDGEIAGTPMYMSPEQAAGKLDKMDTRSDVYTLGVILFLLLSGEFPHDVSGQALSVMNRIATFEPRRFRDIEPRADRELEAILLKALAREPQHRYGTAGELADDLERYLSHEPLVAQPPTARYLLRKKLRKYRSPLAVAGAFGVTLVGMAVFSRLFLCSCGEEIPRQNKIVHE